MIDPHIIIERAAAAFGTTPEAIIGHRRFARLAPPRQAVAWALRQLGLGLCEIGELLHRDHTTIIASIARAEERAAEDEEYAQALRLLIVRPGALHAAVAQTRESRTAARPTPPALRVSLAFWGVSRPSAA